MKKLKLAYAGGLFDAEGCVVASCHKRPGNQSTQYLVSCVIANTHHGVIEWLHEHFGGNVVYRPARGRQREHWRWSVWCQEAVAFLKQVLPYIILKKRQSKVGIMLQGGERKDRRRHFLSIKKMNQERGIVTCRDFSGLSGRVATAYAAGFYDGEGNYHVSVTKKGYEDTNMQLGNTELSVLQWLKERYGGSLRDRSKDPSRRGFRPLWTWTLKSRQARRFVEKVQKYLIIKAA